MNLRDIFRAHDASIDDENPPKDDRLTGKIIKLSDQGWGFIISPDVKFTRIFFHWSQLRQDTKNFKDLTVGMTVKFKLVHLEGRGHRATQISVIE